MAYAAFSIDCSLRPYFIIYFVRIKVNPKVSYNSKFMYVLPVRVSCRLVACVVFYADDRPG